MTRDGFVNSDLTSVGGKKITTTGTKNKKKSQASSKTKLREKDKSLEPSKVKISVKATHKGSKRTSPTNKSKSKKENNADIKELNDPKKTSKQRAKLLKEEENFLSDTLPINAGDP